MTELQREIEEALALLPPRAEAVRLFRVFLHANVPLATFDGIDTITQPVRLERLRSNWNPDKLQPLDVWNPPPPGHSPVLNGNHRLTYLREIGADSVPVLLRLGPGDAWSDWP